LKINWQRNNGIKLWKPLSFITTCITVWKWILMM
jgi:hypothetical protein